MADPVVAFPPSAGLEITSPRAYTRGHDGKRERGAMITLRAPRRKKALTRKTGRSRKGASSRNSGAREVRRRESSKRRAGRGKKERERVEAGSIDTCRSKSKGKRSDDRRETTAGEGSGHATGRAGSDRSAGEVGPVRRSRSRTRDNPGASVGEAPRENEAKDRSGSGTGATSSRSVPVRLPNTLSATGVPATSPCLSRVAAAGIPPEKARTPRPLGRRAGSYP